MKWSHRPLLGAALIGCAGPAPEQPQVAIHDSAGVQIVENRIEPTDLPSLRLAFEPRLRIGVVEGDESYMFDRISGVAALSDGRLAVVNGGSREIRLFDRDGRFVWAVGGPGEGPGEFSRPAGLFVQPGDTLLVYDGDLQRVTRIAPDGEVASVRPVEASVPLMYVSGVFGDGSLLVVGTRQRDTEVDGFRSSQFLIRHRPDGSPPDSLGSFPPERWVHYRDQFFIQPLFQGSPVSAVRQTEYLAAAGEAYRFQVHRMDGVPIRSVRWRGPDLSVTDQALDLYWEERLVGLEGERLRSEMEQRERMPVSERFPALDWLAVTPSGAAWVRSFARPGSDVQEWLVFDPDGVLRARVELPPVPAYFPRAFGDSWIAGQERDDLGVEYVVVHDLVENRD